MKLLNEKEQIVDSVDFGVVEAGKKKTVTYTLKNETIADVVDLKIKATNREVEISDVPDKIDAKETTKIKFSWTPNRNVKKGLKTVVVISGTELYK